MALWAHEHAYERLWPVYNREVSETEQTLFGNMLVFPAFIPCFYMYKYMYISTTAVSCTLPLLSQVMNGSYYSPYTNPRAPVHIITGSAVSEVYSVVDLFISALLVPQQEMKCFVVDCATEVLMPARVDKVYATLFPGL